MGKKAIGIDIGGTAIKGAVIDENGICGSVTRVPTEAAKGGRRIMENILSLIGKLIDRVGYKAVMVADTLILIAVCLFYGFAHRLFVMNIAYIVVCCNFVLDSIISIASMASNVYVKRIASNQEEVTATLSTGISVNHVISILIALMGGWIWKVTSIEVLFSLSAVFGLINSIYAATIKTADEERKNS